LTGAARIVIGITNHQSDVAAEEEPKAEAQTRWLAMATLGPRARQRPSPWRAGEVASR